VVSVKKTPKKSLFFGVMIILIAGFIWGYALQSDIAAQKAPDSDSPVVMVPASFSELAKQAQPGVVNIRTVKTVKGGGRVFRHFFGNPFDPRDPTSGHRTLNKGVWDPASSSIAMVTSLPTIM